MKISTLAFTLYYLSASSFAPADAKGRLPSRRRVLQDAVGGDSIGVPDETAYDDPQEDTEGNETAYDDPPSNTYDYYRSSSGSSKGKGKGKGGREKNCRCEHGFAYYKYDSAVRTWQGALEATMPSGPWHGCTLAPMSSKEERDEIALVIPDNTQAWIGVTKSTHFAKKQFWCNPSGSPTCATTQGYRNGGNWDGSPVSPVDGWRNIDGSHWPVKCKEANCADADKFWDRTNGNNAKKEPNNDNSSGPDQQVPPQQTRVVMNNKGLMADKAPAANGPLGQPNYGAVYKCCQEVCLSYDGPGMPYNNIDV